MRTLDRFIEIQKENYSRAFGEIKSGKKMSHWMWYIFPQIDGLVMNPSFNSSWYSIQNNKEALDFYNHPILGNRLTEITRELLNLNNNNIESILGHIDSLKLKSCMTLFDVVTEESIILFADVLDKYFSGSRDQKTLNILEIH